MKKDIIQEIRKLKPIAFDPVYQKGFHRGLAEAMLVVMNILNETIEEDTPMTIKLITQHVHPPIGTRLFDWCCYPAGDEESSYYGWGMTEQAAIKDWHDTWDETIAEDRG